MAGHSFAPFLRAANKAPCAEQNIHTQLSSPNEAVLSQLKRDDILQIGFLNDKQIIVGIFDGQIAGVILNRDILKLISCMQQGFQFIAIVRQVRGGMCAITIKTYKGGADEE
jgi:hypothetical protein